MCILSFMPANVPADITALRNGGLSNPHGHGWALIARDDNGNQTILVGKSMDLETALEEFRAAREEHPGGPALFHSRWATHGSTNEDNCHPFQVGGSPLTVVAHNGILPANAHPGRNDKRSDTRKFADEILCTRYRRLDKPRAFEALGNYCGSGNKLVILTIDPKYKHNAYLVNPSLGAWDKDSGIWHSNDAWKDEPYWYSGNYSRSYHSGAGAQVYTFGRKDDHAERECFICGMGNISKAGYCYECYSCESCLEFMDDCKCWDVEDQDQDQEPETVNLPAVRPESDRYWDRANETVTEWLERTRAIRAEHEAIELAAARDDSRRIADAWAAKYGSNPYGRTGARDADGGYCSPQRAKSIGDLTEAEWQAMQFDQ